MKHQILVDMDGVLADVYAQYIALEYAESGIKLIQKELNGIREEELPAFRKHVQKPGFFRTVPLMPDSIEGLRYLNNKYSVLIVSSATEFPNSLIEKQQWLNEYFPFISWKQMIFCGRKDSIKGSIMIDDHPKNLGVFSGKKIIFTQPHNTCLRDNSYHRVSGWKDIMEIL
ncbi:5'(3')-deoxyribonucleotidase [Bacteroides sp. 51]|uniref:5' nucleotidase, NT5C type n=1 Tax=Bacteroides sp. 51 TaxID=2302938 RepID=UPI0013D2AA2E|nr:5'(3')-deoxyribonucleotidase [Bacteroides sp. 51]NDV82279.1 5'(3')-deoxyribonucleotidase [Bacteroides sp. 51]